MTNPGDPPSALEQRGTELGITFRRGRTWSSSSLLALEAAEHVTEHEPGHRDAYHKALFKAYFEDLADIGKPETLVEVAGSCGVDTAALADALANRTYQQQVEDGINWARSIGVSAVPTFVIDEEHGVVGAQPFEVLDRVMQKLGKTPRA